MTPDLACAIYDRLVRGWRRELLVLVEPAALDAEGRA